MAVSFLILWAEYCSFSSLSKVSSLPLQFRETGGLHGFPGLRLFASEQFPCSRIASPCYTLSILKTVVFCVCCFLYIYGGSVIPVLVLNKRNHFTNKNSPITPTFKRMSCMFMLHFKLLSREQFWRCWIGTYPEDTNLFKLNDVSVNVS